MLKIALFFAFLIDVFAQGPDTRGMNPVCLLPKAPGTECPQGRATVRWYYNPTIGTCVSFMFSGCFANDNNFRTSNDCIMACTFADGPVCAPLTKPDGLCQPDSLSGCKPGFKCMRGAFLAHCCNAQKEEEYQAAVSPKCEKGEAYRPDQFGSVLLADTCKEMICPLNHKCVQGKTFAHCCEVPADQMKKIPKPTTPQFTIGSPDHQFRPPVQPSGLLVAGNTVEQFRPIGPSPGFQPLQPGQTFVPAPFGGQGVVTAPRRDPRCYSQPRFGLQGSTMFAWMYYPQANRCIRIPTNWFEMRQYFFRVDECVNACGIRQVVPQSFGGPLNTGNSQPILAAPPRNPTTFTQLGQNGNQQTRWIPGPQFVRPFTA